jgi:hypothetical protein
MTTSFLLCLEAQKSDKILVSFQSALIYIKNEADPKSSALILENQLYPLNQNFLKLLSCTGSNLDWMCNFIQSISGCSIENKNSFELKNIIQIDSLKPGHFVAFSKQTKTMSTWIFCFVVCISEMYGPIFVCKQESQVQFLNFPLLQKQLCGKSKKGLSSFIIEKIDQFCLLE